MTVLLKIIDAELTSDTTLKIEVECRVYQGRLERFQHTFDLEEGTPTIATMKTVVIQEAFLRYGAELTVEDIIIVGSLH